MNLALRWTVVALALAVSAGSTLLGLWAAADARLLDFRFAASDRAPSGDIVFVDIDAGSLARVGVWPWPRTIHAQVLDQLMDMGAFEVIFDVDFSTASNPADDAAFAAALERSGGYAYLAAFQQRDANGDILLNQPLAAFAEHAQPVLVNVQTDGSGLVRSVPTRLETPAIPSLALALAPDARADGATLIDFGLDLNQITRIPAAAILEGSVDPAWIRDRQVVVGASAIELRDFFAVPRFGVVPGPIIQIAAAETLKAGRGLVSLGPWPALIVAGLFIWFQVILRRSTLAGTAAIFAAAAIAAEVSGSLALTLGAVDLATMPLHAAMLVTLGALLMQELSARRCQMRMQQERLAYLANHDLNTGALSRVALTEAIAESHLRGRTVWLLLVKLERLGNAGASLGQELAERAVVQACDRLRFLDLGTICRLETDSFAILRSRPLEAGAIDRLLETLDAPYEVGGHRLGLAARWGASGLIALQAAPEEPIRRAQIALAGAVQRATRGEEFIEAFDIAVQQRQAMDIALRSAVANNELDLVFQSQLDMRRREVVGFESLVRWNSPTLGAVSPGQFIPLAEENGAIVPLGAWVMRESCRRAVECGWSGWLSVNVSAVQFQHDDVVAMVGRALHETGFPAERLIVEITESLFVEGGERIVSTLHGLRALGTRIAIDDFGTGFSSLNYLSRLPVDKLKIDQSFVRALPDTRSAGVIEAIVSLARRLELGVVVEGVETEDQFEFLAEIGCDVAQGYLFGRAGPIPAIIPHADAA